MSGWKDNNDHHNLHFLTLGELEIIYPKYTRNHLQVLIKQHKKKGCAVERTEPYEGPEQEKEATARRRKRVAPVVGMVAINVPEQHAVYHQELQEALDEHGYLKFASFTDWQALTKNADGEAEIHDLHRKRFDVAFDHEPKWPPVTRVESVTLPKKESKKAPETSRTAVILPDIQFPFVDEQALSIALQVLRDVKPDKVILLGDALDLSAWGKYVQMPEWATATQGAIIQLHQLLATIRKIAPTSEIVVMAGNHEARMANHLKNNAMAAYGLKKADDPEGWPVMSVPYLCAFDKLDVDYVDGYPANRYWINERLQVRHGHLVRSGASTARAVSDDERVSTIFGHVHRIETQYKTVNVYDGGRTNFAHTPGCLCRIDGHVPSMKGGTDQRTNQPVQNYENWQQGLSVVNYHDGDNAFNLEQIYINTFQDYETMYRGKTYRP